MNNFRIIALRPLYGCNPEFLKVLAPNEFYRFYQDYDFKVVNIDGEEKITITHNSTVPDNLFSSLQKPAINISAIVGKNGSGKSTLIELLFVAINIFAIEKKILKNTKDHKAIIPDNIKLEIYYVIDESIFCLRIDSSDSELQKTIITLKRYSDKLIKRNFTLDKLLGNTRNFITDFFFYTIAVNYSIYSLNSDQLGNWIIPLFHKNDSYQTPLVINPMRTKGNFDIKIENDLVKQRLLANILEKIPIGIEADRSLRNIAPGKTAIALELTFNDKKLEYYERINSKRKINNGQECVWKLYKGYTGLNFNLSVEPEPEFVRTEIYVLYKLVKICRTYNRYKKFFKKNEFVKIDKLIETILDDSSHITFKIKQALNFLRYKLYKNWKSNSPYILEIEKFSIYIDEVKTEDNNDKRFDRILRTIELIPPSLFEVKIIFEKNGTFDECSSGEKQKIHSISSIIYHLINLNSVFRNQDSKHEKLTLFKYKYVNILFDEVELYFHPELQRQFVYDLVKYIEKVNYDLISEISGINICFATHSPFILSDIPDKNVLYLKVDKTTGKSIPARKNSKTFGANIHNLLKNDFFMENGFMGELAKEKIQEVADYINRKDSEIKNNKQAQEIIDLIGEPLLKERLEFMLVEKRDAPSKDQIIEDLRKELEKYK